ncbi:MAG: hypothetical protein KatS3mg031_2866 [Chitinophagales bacterium]|nr:MAG: hypothetical protein KatS3mg031_2858 [Chitinophagales bacterium]GIV35331.1 MAG: hypothetical protein KatS3mg031_2866 [Chitinophagales bacterium]
MKLRDYQAETIARLRELFRGHRRVLLCLPTGGGKTVIFSHIAKLARSECVVLVHRRELQEQAARALARVGAQGVTVEMIMTYRNKVKRGEPTPGFVIIDEAHRGEFIKLLEIIPENTFVLGVTATPILTGKRSLSEFYSGYYEPLTTGDLVEKGYLCRCAHYGVPEVKEVKLYVRQGEYTPESQEEYFRGAGGVENVLNMYHQYAAGRQAVVFCPSLKLAREIAGAFGDTAEIVDGGMDTRQREAIIEGFKRGDIRILTNVDIVTTGFDYPALDTIILARKTKSRALYFQMLGRGARKHPGKDYFTVLDLGNNFQEHGLYDDPTNRWEPYFYGNHLKKSAGDEQGVPPAKSCIECLALLHPRAQFCHVCGAEQPKPKKEAVRVEKMVEISKLISKRWEELAIDELDAYASAKGYKHHWVIHQLLRRGRHALEEYAALKGYKHGWVAFTLSKIAKNKLV